MIAFLKPASTEACRSMRQAKVGQGLSTFIPIKIKGNKVCSSVQHNALLPEIVVLLLLLWHIVRKNNMHKVVQLQHRFVL